MNRHFDFGRLAVALALIILLIFGVDFIRRSLLQLFHKQPDIQLEGNNSSFLDTVDSVTDPVLSVRSACPGQSCSGFCPEAPHSRS